MNRPVPEHLAPAEHALEDVKNIARSLTNLYLAVRHAQDLPVATGPVYIGARPCGGAR